MNKILHTISDRNLLFSLLLSLCFSVQAQNKGFSGKTETYIDELKEFMTNLPEQYEPVLEEFNDAWTEDSLFSREEQENIAVLSRMLVGKKARPYPHIFRFLSCMLAFEHYNISEENYKNWIEGFKELLDRRKTKTFEFDNLLEVTDILLRNNYLYSSPSTTWKARSKNFKIVFDEKLTVLFEKTDLVCISKRDSIELLETRGVLDPVENVWNGSTGLVTWERGGYNRNEVFAYLKDYQIDLRHAEYSAEHVIFTNKLYFDEPLEGILEDKIKYNVTIENATYPKFDSYTKKYIINDLYENIDFEGGLSMQGAKLVGTGTTEENAQLKIYRNDTLVLKASSVYFGFRIDRVSSQRTAITIKLKNDSIFHADLFFTYRVDKRELTLLKSDNFSSRGPYYNSYHKIDMNFDQLTWDMDEEIMRFSAPRGSAIGEAYFESVNYFNHDKYMDMMMMDQQHPLYLLKKFAEIYGYNDFPVSAYADYQKMSLQQVQHQMMRMAYGGFVFYDINTDRVSLKQRLFDYLDASVNRIDYDVISFLSRVEAPLENAIFDIRTNDLIINGISEIQVSDSQNVIIYPRNNRLILKNNRNFQFDGVVDAGLLTFYGDNFFFHYDSFKVNLQSVDSLHLDFMTERLDNFGLPIIDEVTSRLQYITGEVLIDKPDNKSGRHYYPEYPVFKSKESSYVYYNKSSIQDGAYSASDFYFEVYPFEMDSLDNFNYKDLNFKGHFVSAGIFPELDKELRLQPDNSLGFRHITPPEGHPVYSGKGTYYNQLWLSNKGLRGNGKLEYLTSTTWSEDFIFYPDSMNTLSARYEIAKSTTEQEYPQVRSLKNYIHWMPYADYMDAEKTDTDFSMFNDSTKLSGRLKLRPTGLSGSGRMDLTNAELQSELFTYEAEDIYSDTADFYLKSLNTKGFTVLTDNMNTHIDYSQQKGWIKSNEEYTKVLFPDNDYVSYLNNFLWDMRKKELAMGSDTASGSVDYTYEDIEPEGPRYISLHYQQDSLNFVAPLAYYDYKNNQINAKGVKFFEVADARIYPDKGEVTVEREAKMRTLENTRIRANKTSKYHTLHTSTVNITSRNYYEGFGIYDYIDENEEVQKIHFKELKVDSGGNTIASGDIYESAGFRLSPVYKFQGKSFLRAPDSLLTFRGSVVPVYDCENPVSSWLYFQSEIDPLNIYIPVSGQPVDINRQKIHSGMYMYYDSVHVYPAFFSKEKSYSDRTLITSEGYLHYDKAAQLFKIGSKEKINDFTLPADYLSLHREDCKLYGEGKLDLGESLGQVKLNTYGNVRYNANNDETALDVIMMVDFYLSAPMLALMANEIDSAEGLAGVDLNRAVWKKTLNRIVGPEKTQSMQEELGLYGTIKDLPPELRHTFIFNDLKLKWNNETNSYQSVGKIGIASIGDVQINKLVDGYLELQIKRSGDILDFYLEIDRRKYYYFGYTRGVMQTLAGNRDYVGTIMNMKTRDRKMKTPGNETPYIFMISTDRKKDIFYMKYRNAVEGIPTEAEDENNLME